MPAKTSKSLFSDHYLTRRLPQHPEWRDKEAVAALQTAVALYSALADRLPTFNEAQTEQEFIQPMLEQVLGFEGAYSVQTAVRQQGRVQRPDYALFPNAATKTEADRHLGDEAAFFSRAAAVADAKYWQRPLSQKRATEFYEIDLLAIFDAPADARLDAFKRFWLFFRRAAFVPDARGQNFLERVRAGSAGYARVYALFDLTREEIAIIEESTKYPFGAV